jgi:hypothetical protein
VKRPGGGFPRFRQINLAALYALKKLSVFLLWLVLVCMEMIEIEGLQSTVVPAKSDLIDKLGVALFPSIPEW